MKKSFFTNFTKMLFVTALFVFMGFSGWGQATLPHLDVLNYTVGQGLQTQTGWTTLNSGDNLLIASGNLTYTGLPASSGNKVTFDAAGIDAAKLFTQQTSGTVYYSFLLNVTALGSLGTTGGYFSGFNEGTSTTYGGTVWSRSDGAGFDIGINPRTTAANTVWSSGTTSLNTTLFIVISYQIVSGATNDIVKMWINPALGGTEPSATLSATNALTDLANVNRILIRQDGASATPFIEMDELRIGTTWSSVTPSGGSTTPTLSADASDNNVDNNIDITFNDDATWRAAITAVKIGSTALTPTTDYLITSGNLQLIPSGGNALLTTSGSKSVTVVATGYTDAPVTQVINVGAVSTSTSTATINSPLAQGATRTITLTAKDQYSNLVSGYAFKYDIVITNLDGTTNESYTIDGTPRTSNALNVNAPTTDLSGVATFTAVLPATVDGDDGISIQIQLNDGTTNLGSAFSFIQLLSQIITFDALAAVTYGNADFDLTASASSGLTVSYQSSNLSVATVSGVTVTIVGQGTTDIKASQGGNSSYNAAEDVTQTLTVNKKALTISGAAAQNKVYTGTDAAVITGSLSGIVGTDDVTLNGTGIFDDVNVANGIGVTSTSTLGGAKAGNYSLTQPTGLTANITQATQTITFGALANKLTSDPDYSPGATSPTSGTNAITYASSNTAVATIVSDQIHIIATGTTTITASQAGSLNYTAAADVAQSLTVNVSILMHNGIIADYPTWVYNSCNQASGYMSLLTNTSSLISPAVNLNAFNTELLIFKARTYGGVTGNSAEITVSISTNNGDSWTVLGTRTPANTTLTEMASFDLSAYSGTLVKIKFETLSAASSKGAGIDDISLAGINVTDATYNTISIEGTNSGWNAGEIFSNITTADNAHFTWDTDYLYYAISDNEADYNNQATFMFFNTDPDNLNNGTTSAYMWGQNVITPFKVNKVLVWKNNPGDDYMELMSWNGSSWVQTFAVSDLNYNSGEVEFAIGTAYREIKIARSTLGVSSAGSKIKVASITEQQWSSNYRYYGWPLEGWTNGNRTAGQTLSHSYNYTLDEYIYPNQAQYLKKDLYVSANTTLSNDENFDNIFIQPNSNLTIDAGKTVTVDGNFTILSDASGTGSLIDNGTLNVAGSTKVQKYLPTGTLSGWYISSPVTLADSNLFNPSSQGLYSYDAANAKWIHIPTATLIPLTGYVTKFTTNQTVEFTGALNTGNVSRSNLIRTGFQTGNFGWNLVGNPYPSPIDWNLVVGTDNPTFISTYKVDPTIYTRKSDGSVATFIANGVGTNDGTNIIAAMQAFWIRVNANYIVSNASLSFNNSHRAVGANNILKTANDNVLKLKMERGTYNDESIIRFISAATNLYDAVYDAAKMYSLNDEHPQIYTIDADNEAYAINTLSDLSTVQSVILGFNTKISGTFTITADNLSSFDSNVSIYLEDTKSNSLIDLRQQNSYTFNSNVIESTDRFVVHFGLLATNTENGSITDSDINIFANDKNIYIANVTGDNALVSVFNLLGQEVLSQQLVPSSLNKLNTNLPTGQYIVRIIDNNKISTQKIYIN